MARTKILPPEGLLSDLEYTSVIVMHTIQTSLPLEEILDRISNASYCIAD